MRVYTGNGSHGSVCSIKEITETNKSISLPIVSTFLAAPNMKITILAVIVTITAVQGYQQGYQQQSYRTSEYNSPAPYSFAWDVNDYASKNNYAHSEGSNGNAVTGSYRVALPDGRTQYVTYRADHNGYVADVKYDGEAKYPEYKPTASYSFPAYQAPARSYPAPAYKAPAYPTYRAPAYAAPAAVQGKRGYAAAPGYNTQPAQISYRG